MPLLTRNTFIGAAKESTIGTYVAPTVFIPVTSPKPEDMINMIDDTAFFGNPSKIRGEYQGEKDSTFDFDGPLYPEVVGHLLVMAGLLDTTHAYRTVTDGVTTGSTTITSATAAFTQADVGASVSGAADLPVGAYIVSVTNATTAVLNATTTGGGGTGETFNIGTSGQTRHRFALAGSGSGQPPTYSLTDYDVYEARGFPGQILDTLDITIDGRGMVKYAAKMKGWPSAGQSTPSPTFPTSASFLGWEAATVIAGAPDNRFMSATISIKRSADIIHTLRGSQSPYTSYSGEFDVTLKVKTLFEDNTELNEFLNNSQPALYINLAAPSAGPTLSFSVQKAAWKKSALDRGQQVIQIDSDIQPVYNSADSGMISAVLQNGVSTAY